MDVHPQPTAPEPTALDADLIRDRLKSAGQRTVSVRVAPEVDSTNTQLARLRAAGETVDVLIAEAQSAGRGRRGRQWISPPGCGLYLSLFRAFAGPVRRLEALGLVAGLAGAAAIQQCCGLQTGLKWPNDIQIDGRKVAGCLIDLGGTDTLPSAIIGIGINIDFRGQTGPEQPWTDLRQVSGHVPDRNRLAAVLIEQLSNDLQQFDARGFVALQARWDRQDVLVGRKVEAWGTGERVIRGYALGVDQSGRLMIQAADRLHRLHGGEVTLKTRQ